MIDSKYEPHDVFTPTVPIEDKEFFSGRKKEMGKCEKTLTMLGTHIAIFGPRGIGKTSLAKTSVNVSNIKHLFDKVIQIQCDEKDKYSTIALDIANRIDSGTCITQSEEYSATKGKINAGILNLLGADYSTDSSQKTIKSNLARPDNTRWLADDIIQTKKIVIVIDEFDLIDDSEKRRFAPLIKNLSDSRSLAKLVFVGVARTIDTLMGGHKSLPRSLKTINLPRLSNEEIDRIIVNGANKLGLTFTKEAREKIVETSYGFPYFTHLISLCASERACSTESRRVTYEDINVAIERSANDAQNELKQSYNDAIRTQKDETTLPLEDLLFCASFIKSSDIRLTEIENIYRKLFGEDISKGFLHNTFVKKCVSENDYTTIFSRISKGVYQFNDPRMIPYIKMRNYHR